MTTNFEDGDDVVGVMIRLEIEDQWRESKYSERGRGENTAIEARPRSVMQNFSRRTRIKSKIVGKFIHKFLNARWRFQRA